MLHLLDISTILLESAGNPRRAALKTLQWIQDWCGARSVALWRVEDDSIALSLGLAIDSFSEVNARELWRDRTPAADDSAPMWGDNGTTLLLRTQQPSDMLIYVDGVERRTVDLPSLVSIAAIAANALRRSPHANTSKWAGGMGTTKREELNAALRLHEWNIARVSRVLGVTRKTIYDRMQRFGIDRERVPK